MGQPISAYERAGHVDAEAELEALGLPIAERFLLYAQKLVSRRVDHLSLQPFAEYSGVSAYMASFGAGGLVFFVVQDDLGAGVSVTVMLAVPRSPCTVDGQAWDGQDLTFLRDGILMPRLEDYLI